jgi:hypothetical protein
MALTPRKTRQLLTTIPLGVSLPSLLIFGALGFDKIMWVMLIVFILSLTTTTLWVLSRAGGRVVNWWKSEE